ncbi:MAG TPA: GNAT family N-acetyltransferase [Pyrinomonadaceae bacterium]
MPDLLVNLLKAPAPAPLADHTITIRRAQPFESSLLSDFITTNFNQAWTDEVSIGFSRQPVSIFIATSEKRIVGFAAYECTRRGFFGPTGVAPDARNKGIGKALLLSALQGLREMGYVYAIIGHAGPIDFYQKEVGAIVIPDSDPGIYTDLLKSN